MIYNMAMQTPVRRKSKYVEAVKNSLEYFGHATNAQITDDLRRSYPHVSDTTIHRITQRLLEDGEIAQAPPAWDGSMVYDANIDQHDHFQCSQCDGLRDIVIPAAGRRSVRGAIAPCRLDGPLLIMGTCKDCLED